ncbi:MAG: 23S rRNA (uracil(1939)-C(5))-methyltransferase RlmD [Lachnospiraceae bacterium]|nr:23S rRNA (uracil(1939)-C(5))-methyltransferase RlmD [Lachnospiraceae bacterium]
MDKNEIFKVTIEDMTNEGLGVGKVSGFPLFIKDAVIGDEIEVRVVKVKKTYGYGRVESIITPSPSRVDAPCSIARPCGGCQIMNMNYDAQIHFKENKVINNLTRIGGFSRSFIDEVKDNTLSAASYLRYRNKAQFPVGFNKNGAVVTGFYGGHSHDIVPCDDCLLLKEECKDIVNAVKRWMGEYGVSAYDEETGRGVVRHILIRCGENTGEWMVCLVINADSLDEKHDTKGPGASKPSHADALISALKEVLGDALKSVCISVNKARNNVILGDNYKVLYGEGYIHESLGDITYRISPLSFFQVNSKQCVRLYNKVLEYGEFNGTEDVWDLYCGTGSISLFMARHVKCVHGIEIIPEAIEDAKKNASDNGIKNADFIVGAAEDVFTEKMKNGASRPDIVVVDPPRKGCDEKLINTILKMSPRKVIYVSCDSATLSRDLKLLCESAYALKKFSVVDQFPNTVHTEVICRLEIN